jgi:hypothetical protein
VVAYINKNLNKFCWHLKIQLSLSPFIYLIFQLESRVLSISRTANMWNVNYKNNLKSVGIIFQVTNISNFKLVIMLFVLNNTRWWTSDVSSVERRSSASWIVNWLFRFSAKYLISYLVRSWLKLTILFIFSGTRLAFIYEFQGSINWFA